MYTADGVAVASAGCVRRQHVWQRRKRRRARWVDGRGGGICRWAVHVESRRMDDR
jgi:hypothetical protein